MNFQSTEMSSSNEEEDIDVCPIPSISKNSDLLKDGIHSPRIRPGDASLRRPIHDLYGNIKSDLPRLPFKITPDVWVYELRLACKSIVHSWILTASRAMALYKESINNSSNDDKNINNNRDNPAPSSQSKQSRAILSDIYEMWKKWKRFNANDKLNITDFEEDCPANMNFIDMVFKIRKPIGVSGGGGDRKNAIAIAKKMKDIRMEIINLSLEFIKIRFVVEEAAVRLEDAGDNEEEVDAVMPKNVFLFPFCWPAQGGVVGELPEDIVEMIEQELARKAAAYDDHPNMHRILTHTPNYVPLGQPTNAAHTNANGAAAMSAMLSADQGGNENDDGRPIDELIDEMIASEWNSGMTLQPNTRNDNDENYKDLKMKISGMKKI